MSLRFSGLSCFCIAALLCGVSAPVFAEAVDFSADSMSHDEAMNIVTARGNVEITQAGRILKADEVIYNVADDRVTARGNVVLLEANGDVHFADEVDVTDRMREGYVRQLRSTLTDGSRFWAEEGQRIGDGTTVMTAAAYTPCALCETNPDAPPAWALRAGEVRHEKEDQRIVYNNATFELWGVPVVWLPYFTHADGTVKQKSGFLTPSFGYKSDLGVMLGNSYYFALDPSYDLTLGLTAMSNQAPLLTGEYRQRFENAQLILSGSTTYAKRTDLREDTDVRRDAEMRGHLFAKGRWDIDEKWRAGLGVEVASDDQYMRQYDFSSKDVLENELYVERFSGRDYAVARALGFQDIRVVENQTDQPNVLPEIVASFLGEPGQVLGGRWSADVSTLSLNRTGKGQDMNRIVTQLGWQRRFTSDTGLVSTVDLTARADGYSTNDRDLTQPGSGTSNSGEKGRAFAQAHVVASYPLVKPLERAQIVVEPTIALTAAPDVSNRSSAIPNEDSQDAQIDASNLFNADRFPGLDRIEDNSRVTYGVRTSLHGDEGSRVEVFAGQSYRFSDRNNPFPDGSGLSDRKSDIVGQVVADYKQRFGLNYRFQLDNDNLASRRHEAGAYASVGPVRVNAQYLFANPIEGTSLDDNREQVSVGMAYRVNPEWQVRSAVLHDLGADPGLRRATFGVDYSGECFTTSATLDRNLTRNSSGESSTEIFFRIGLKNLGEFQTSGISLGGSARDDADNSTTLMPPE